MADGPDKAQALLLRKHHTETTPGQVLDFQTLGSRTLGRIPWLGVTYRVAATILLAGSLGLLSGLLWQGREPGRRSDEQVNLPLAHLALGHVRDDGEPLKIAASASSFLLVVETRVPFPAYGLEIRRKDTDALVWTNDALTQVQERTSRIDPILLTALLPRRLFDTGEHRVLLQGFRGGRSEAIEEFLLRVHIE